MFDIEYKGGNTVIITTKKVTVVIDPKTSIIGLKDVKLKGNVEIATESRFAITNEDAKLQIEGPGEYGFADFDIVGIAAQRHLDTEKDPKRSTIYRIEVGDVRIGLLGNVYEKVAEEQLEQLGVIDVLITPVGGNGYTLDATGAASLIRQIEPKVVIPVHYADSALKYEVPQDTLETFTKELGAPVEETSKYKVKNAAALPAALTVVALTRS